MAKTVPALDDALIKFIEGQHVFFVATAPRGPEGHVNLSPKGYDTFRILGPTEVAYLDLTGSGAETVAHLRDDGRITLLFCGFDAKPNLVRLYGRGRAVEPGDDGFESLIERFPGYRGARAVIVVSVERISTSCGYSVPFMAYQGERPTLEEWVGRRSEDDLAEYRAANNRHSIDGLPALAQA